MVGFVLELDDLPLIETIRKGSHNVDVLKVFKTKEEVAAKLMLVAHAHPHWNLNFYEAPATLEVTPSWFKGK